MPVLKNVKVLFCNVLSVDDLSQKFQVVVDLDEDQTFTWEELGFKVKESEYNGRIQNKVTFKTKRQPDVYGLDGKSPMDLSGREIGKGSVVNVQYKPRNWTSMDKKSSGIATDLDGIQVVAGSGMNEFGDLEVLGSGEVPDTWEDE